MAKNDFVNIRKNEENSKEMNISSMFVNRICPDLHKLLDFLGLYNVNF
jgi:hypothetical protein